MAKLMRCLLLLIAACAAVVVGPFAAVCRAADRPNLLIIHVDEFNLDMLGCYGGEIVGTPNIDWLAAHGAKCTKFYATTPVCSPSRAAFVSGLYPHHTPVTTNNIPLYDRIRTFASELSAAGYATGYAGKWHLDGDGKPQWAPERKFGFQDNRYMFNRGHWKKMEDTPEGPRVAARNAKGQPTYDVAGADEKSFTTDWLTTKALDFVGEHASKPFCFMVSIPDPHGPNTVRPPYDTMYDDVEVPIPASLHKKPEQIPAWGRPEKGVNEATLRKIMPQYYGMVKCIDDNVGRVLAELRRRDLLEKTIIVFTADHGDLCGEHGRLNKGVPYEKSARIPFIVYYPPKIPAGTVVDEVLTCVDFKPTILSLMGVEEKTPSHGRDASALLQGKAVPGWKDIAVIRGTGPWLCAISGDYKLVVSAVDRPWLFDLKADPLELNNQADKPEYRDVLRRLARAIVDYGRKYDDPYLENEKLKPTLDAILSE
ncbi:sulfatase [Thermostilla marina]